MLQIHLTINTEGDLICLENAEVLTNLKIVVKSLIVIVHFN